jgi:hypothetical protein
MAEPDPAWCQPHPSDTHPVPRDGRRHCGVLEQVLRCQWDPACGPPPAEVVAEVDRLATGRLSQLVRMLGGDEITAEMTWAYYRVQYGLEVRRG